jgi:hypothetical protein
MMATSRQRTRQLASANLDPEEEAAGRLAGV